MDSKVFYGKKYSSCASLNKLLDKLNKENFDSANIYINPPAEDSEGDSELSDDETVPDFSDKFSSKILRASAEATLISKNGTAECQEIVTSDDDEDEQPLSNYVNQNKKQKLSTPREMWEKGDLMKHINQQSVTNHDYHVPSGNPVEILKKMNYFGLILFLII